jgi:hypothetical protein
MIMVAAPPHGPYLTGFRIGTLPGDGDMRLTRTNAGDVGCIEEGIIAGLDRAI